MKAVAGLIEQMRLEGELGLSSQSGRVEEATS
jgi:hypothetical protein